RRIQLEEAERVARQQQAQLDLAVKQTARLEELVPSGAAAAVELDVARANLSFARTQLAVARSETAQVKSEMSRADIAAPFAGVVAARHGQLGERLAIGDPLVTLVAPGEVEINLIVPTRYAAILDIDEALRVRACEREVAAALTASVPQASGSDRSLLRLALSQQDRLLPGMAVQVEIPIKRLESAIVAPRDALVIRQEGAFVFRVDADRKAEKIPVDVLLGTGMNVAVKRRGEGPGLEAGDLLVVRGAETLQPDAELEPVPAAVRESAAGADAAFDELACR
ncbi:MAG: efflux RND transporter periplasmic adaptor subunit, partial [Pseudomonadota bacterium]